MESLAKSNLEKKLRDVELELGSISYGQLKVQQEIASLKKNVEVSTRLVASLEAERNMILASLNDIKVDEAGMTKAIDEAEAKTAHTKEQLKKLRKRRAK